MVVPLIISIIALAIGPMTYGVARRHGAAPSSIDGFVLVTITGIVFLTILPETLEDGGAWTVAFMVIGLLVPTLVEHALHGAERGTHAIAIVLGLTGLAAHAMLDGAALLTGRHADETLTLLGTGIIIHRIPVGLTAWWLLRPTFGFGIASGTLVLIATGTLIGAAMGGPALAAISGPATAWFQALVAGSLLHVVFHRPHIGKHTHADPQADRKQRHRRFEGGGALLGALFLLFLIRGEESLSTGISRAALDSFVSLSLESAPALLLAYVAAGFMNAFMPESSIRWVQRGGPASQALRGMTFGLPLPICSCGVIPLYRTLIVQGAPPAAAMAFLVATPELGVDAIFLSIPLLGTEMTVVRVVGAALVALLIGWFVGGRLQKNRRVSTALPLSGDAKPPLMVRLRGAFEVGFGEVVDHTAPWILLGLLVAAVATPLLGDGALAGVPSIIQVPAFALLGLPTYVCASAATPMVAALLVGGISPGAALAFLITGPATNATTFGVIASLHGKRAALVFSGSIIGLSVGLGYIVNAVLPVLHTVPTVRVSTETASWLQLLSLGVLVIAVAASVVRRGARGFLAEINLTRPGLTEQPHGPQP